MSKENIKCEEYVIAIQKNRLGDGPEELGVILIKAFVNTLPDIAILPKTIIFLNSGIFFALKDSPVLDALKQLEQRGVEMLSCGTCLNYFQKKNELAVGKVSNMQEIIEHLSRAGKVIYP